MLVLLFFALLGTGAEVTSSFSQIPNSNLGSDFSVNTDTSSTAKKTTSSSTSKANTLSVPPAHTTEDANDRNLFKLIFTRDTDSYYDMPVTIANQHMDLRMDLLQNNVWAMDGHAILGCDDVDDWWSSEEMLYGTESTSLPASVTTQSEYWVTVCAEFGSFTTNDDFENDVPDSNLANGEVVRLPYIDSINVTGSVLTSNFSFNNGQRESLTLSNFSFINANISSVFVGGIGLAGNTDTDSGFLDTLERQNTNLMFSNSYSLYFNQFIDNNAYFAQVLPGVINQKYYVGDLYQFDMLDNTGLRFSQVSNLDFENSLVSSMLIPSTQLDDIILKNDATGNSISLKGDPKDVYPVIFDSRTIFNLVPLDIIVNIAIQTNAFYNQGINRWLVECDTIRSTQASVSFQISNLTIDVPIDDLLINATSSGNPLNFSNGQQACVLTFLPTSEAYSTLGLNFLKYVYLAVDNVGGTIALGASNYALQINSTDYLPLDKDTKPYSQDASSYLNADLMNKTSEDSIAFITSGSIPFATTHNYTSALRLTYSPYDPDANTLTVPARFSGVLITSDEVYITGLTTPTSQDSDVLSAASEGASSSSNVAGNNRNVYWITWLLFVPLGAFLM